MDWKWMFPCDVWNMETSIIALYISRPISFIRICTCDFFTWDVGHILLRFFFFIFDGSPLKRLQNSRHSAVDTPHEQSVCTHLVFSESSSHMSIYITSRFNYYRRSQYVAHETSECNTLAPSCLIAPMYRVFTLLLDYHSKNYFAKPKNALFQKFTSAHQSWSLVLAFYLWDTSWRRIPMF